MKRCAPLSVKPDSALKASFILCSFVRAKESAKKSASMPGVFNLSIDEAVKECAEVKSLGIPGVILFGLPETKDEIATGAWADDGVVQRAARAIKREVPDLLLMGDVCLCEYMSHGHCGIVETDAVRREVSAALREFESQGKKVVAVKTSAQPAAAIVASMAAENYEILNDASLGLARENSGLASQGWHGHHRAFRHDGRPRRRYPHGSR